MAITKDASTPVMVNTTDSASTTWATASFSPPAGSVVIIGVNVALVTSSTTQPTVTVKDSLSNSYTSAAGPSFPTVSGAEYSWSGIFSYYYATAPGSITVTATRAANTAAAGLNLMPYVLDGAAASQAGAATMTVNCSALGMSVEGSITPTQAGSWVIVVANSDSGLTWTPVVLSTDNYYNDTSADLAAYISGHAVTTVPAAETIGWTISVSNTWSLAALEILPAVPPEQRPCSRTALFRSAHY